jgi:transposase
LKFEGEISVSIDNDKFEQDSHWDGLKGYMTNTKLSKQEVIENYAHLWKIEKAFRISKHDLHIRPIFHRLQRRIEAHICIAFTAYKVYKELERQLRIKKATLSPEKAIEIAKTIYSLTVRTPITNQPMTKILLLNEEQKNLADLFGF